MIRVAVFHTLSDWKKLGFVLNDGVKKPFAWTSTKGIPMYEIKQMHKKE